MKQCVLCGHYVSDDNLITLENTWPVLLSAIWRLAAHSNRRISKDRTIGTECDRIRWLIIATHGISLCVPSPQLFLHYPPSLPPQRCSPVSHTFPIMKMMFCKKTSLLGFYLPSRHRRAASLSEASQVQVDATTMYLQALQAVQQSRRRPTNRV